MDSCKKMEQHHICWMELKSMIVKSSPELRQSIERELKIWYHTHANGKILTRTTMKHRICLGSLMKGKRP